MSASPLVWFWQGVLQYTDLATQVRQACGMTDGWQRVDRVSYAKCGPGDNAPDLRWRQIADYEFLPKCCVLGVMACR